MLRRLISATLGVVTAVLLAGLLSAPAQADNTRVAIADFTWSQEPTIDLGESVTWDWIGPDLQHSVTGQAPNATQWDSDRDNPVPRHNLGGTFKVTFDQPGKYLFVCKLHPQAVRGTVTVTNQPGDPFSDPGPQAPLMFDLEPPQVEMVRLRNTIIGWRGNGTMLDFENSERGEGIIEYFRIVKQKRGGKTRNVRKFAGYNVDPVHIGLNGMRVAYRSPTFKPKAGRYVAFFRVEDQNTNASPDFRLDFSIKGKGGK